MMSTSQNPYVGPRTFRRQDRSRFFGREREAQRLLSRVISQRLVLFYAQSGAGKSSLLNTRLIPLLQDADYAVLPVGRVGGELPDGVQNVQNIFLFNLMLSLDHSQSQQSRLQQFAQLSLQEFLLHLTSDDGEHFYYDETVDSDTVGATQAGTDSDVTNSSDDPLATHRHHTTLATDTDGTVDGNLVDEFIEQNFVLIIDQFEEIITTHLGRWQERAAFFEQLDAAMEADPHLWIVLVLREDYVAALDPYAPLLRDKMRARFYMERMGIKAALDAVTKPAEQAGRPFAPGVAETLVDNLRQIRTQSQDRLQLGQFVEPVQLQVVCYQLWENLKERPLGSITEQDLQEAGDVDSALASFYETAIAHVLQASTHQVSQRQLRMWFEEQLITESETRGTVYQGETETANLPNQVVDLLSRQFLLRSEIRAGGTWVELVHDRFVEPILKSNRIWRERNQSPLLQAAERWLESSKDPKTLYTGDRLAEIQEQFKRHPEDYGGLEHEFIEASQSEYSKRKTRRQRQMLVLAGLLVLVMIALSGWALQSRWEAQNQKETAQAAANVARDLAAELQTTVVAAATDVFEQHENAKVAATKAMVEKLTAEAAQATVEKLRSDLQILLTVQSSVDGLVYAKATAEAVSTVAIAARDMANVRAERLENLLITQALVDDDRAVLLLSTETPTPTSAPLSIRTPIPLPANITPTLDPASAVRAIKEDFEQTQATQTVEAQQLALVSINQLNLRAGPSREHEVLAELVKDEEVRILGRLADNSWLQVQAKDSLIGWVDADYLSSPIAIGSYVIADTPTPFICAYATDPQLEGYSDLDHLGCATGRAKRVWSAWQPFQTGHLLWREDTDRVSVFANGFPWRELTDSWSEETPILPRGDPPSKDLLAPKRGFGYVWGLYDDIFKGLGWATAPEQGFCALIQSFEQGFVMRSLSTENPCQNGLYNRAQDRGFRFKFLDAHDSGEWRLN